MTDTQRALLVLACLLFFIRGAFWGIIGDFIRSCLDAFGSKCKQCRNTQVLFFPDSKMPCFTFYNKEMDRNNIICRKGKSCEYFHDKPNEKGKSDLVKLIKCLNSAECTIDLCIFLITEENLFRFIQYLHQDKKVRVRIITDSGAADEMKASNKAPYLQACGIEVKINVQKSGSKFPSLMHNKFAVIDNKTVICGSFNWTKSAILSNDESVIITSQKKTTRKFREKFDELWNKASTFVPQETNAMKSNQVNGDALHNP